MAQMDMGLTVNPGIANVGTSVIRSAFLNRSEHELLKQQNVYTERSYDRLEHKIDRLEDRMDREINQLRSEFKAEMKELKKEIKEEMKEFKKETNARLDSWQPTMDALKVFLAKQR
jgi:DNA anti-recombination protein RmuC